MRNLIVIAAVLGLAAAANAQSPGQKCQATKNELLGKYSNCQSKAEAKLLRTKGACSVTAATACFADSDCPVSESCTKDVAKYDTAVANCNATLQAKWEAQTQRALATGDPCPDSGSLEDIQSALNSCVASVQDGVAGGEVIDLGEELEICSDDLVACNENFDYEIDLCQQEIAERDEEIEFIETSHELCDEDRAYNQDQWQECELREQLCINDLGRCEDEVDGLGDELSYCESDLGTATTSLSTCESDLASCQSSCGGDLGTCTTALNTCESDLGTATTSLSTCTDDLAACESAVSEQGCGLLGVDGDWIMEISNPLSTCATTVSLSGGVATFTLGGGACPFAGATFTSMVGLGTSPNSIEVLNAAASMCAGLFTLDAEVTVDSQCNTMTGSYTCLGTGFTGNLVLTRVE